MRGRDAARNRSAFRFADAAVRRRSIAKEAKHAFLIEQLEKGAATMLNAGEANCGIELLELLLTAFEKAHVAPDAARIRALAALFELLPAHKYTDNKCVALLKHVAAWSKSSESEHGDASLHDLWARKFADAGDLQQANSQYLRGADTAGHVALVQRWAAEGAAAERDLYYARASLQALCFGHLYSASEIHEAALRDTAVRDTPLTHAIGFLIACCERDAAPLFTELRQRYAASFARDPSFTQYLDVVGTKYFKIQPTTAPPSLMSMLQSMMGGMR